MKLYELFEDRIADEWPISDEEFAQMLARVKSEFLAQAESTKDKSGKRRGRPAIAAPIDDQEGVPVPNVAELFQC